MRYSGAWGGSRSVACKEEQRSVVVRVIGAVVVPIGAVD